MKVAKVQHFAYLCGRKHLTFLARALCYWLRRRCHCIINYKACIDPSVNFPHDALGVVIGEGVVIGPRCTIHQNVTIGGRGAHASRTGRLVPVIGSHVLIGAGSSVLGGIFIANDVSIGANTCVVFDVPVPKSLVVGASARIIKKQSDGEVVGCEKLNVSK